MTPSNKEETTQDQLQEFERPGIYSKSAIRGFAIFFSAIFGGVLLMQNLKDLGKKKEANIVLAISILITIAVIIIANMFAKSNSSIGLIGNIAGASFLADYFFKKYIPNEEDYEKKKITKPLIIGLLITLPFIALVLYHFYIMI